MKIGYHNVLAEETVTVSTEATGFEKENAYDNRMGDYWKPTAVPAWLKATGVMPAGMWMGGNSNTDLSANSNDLTVNGTLTETEIVPGLNAYSGFSGSNYLQQPYNSDLDYGTGDWYWAGWFKESSNVTYQCMFMRAYHTGAAYSGSAIYLRINDVGTLTFQITDDGFSSIDTATTTEAFDDDEWHFVVLQRNGSNVELWVDGSKAASDTAIVSAAGSLSNANANLIFGFLQDGSSPLTNGSLTMWSTEGRALSASEILDFYNKEKHYFNVGATLPSTLIATRATTCDYFAMYDHDFAQSGASVVLQYSDDDSAWTNAFDPIYPVTSAPIFKTFTQSSHKYWRIYADGVVKSIGVAMFGKRLDFQRGLTFGFKPPALAQRYRSNTNNTPKGNFVGRTVESLPIKSSLVFNPTFTSAWVRQYWPDLIRHMEKKPFFVLPEDAYPDEAVFCWTPDGGIPDPAYRSTFMELSIPILAKVA